MRFYDLGERNPTPCVLVESLEASKCGYGISGLRSSQSGQLTACGQVLRDAIRVPFGRAVAGESLHDPPASRFPGHTVRRIALPGLVDLCEHLAAVFDLNRVFHRFRFRFSPFLCQGRVSGADLLILLSKTGAPNRS